MRPEAGDVLVDQTMICEASRLLENDPDLNKYTRKMPWWPPTHTERLVHLSTLLDALALHEHLYVLKAELPDYADKLSLRRSLQ
jgi:hypothetical protein